MTTAAYKPPALQAPPPEDFADTPHGWHFFCHRRELLRGPVSRNFDQRRLVAFRAAPGDAPDSIAILDARCAHLGADLGKGAIHNGCLQCPFHHWQYAADGRCTHIPALAPDAIPPFARQRTYPHGFLGPCLFVYTGRTPAFTLPFFPGEDPARFTPSRPFFYSLQCPWYLVGANAFDQQHFLAAHDRVLESTPALTAPSEYSRGTIATLRVAGNSWQDRFIRLFSGPKVTMTVTDYAGTLIFVSCSFRRTTTYGMVNILPAGPAQTAITGMAWIPKSSTALGRALFDSFHARARRYFIGQFLEPDVRSLQGCSYHPRRLISADATMAGYLAWLAETSRRMAE